MDWGKVMNGYNYVDALTEPGAFAGHQTTRSTLASAIGCRISTRAPAHADFGALRFLESKLDQTANLKGAGKPAPFGLPGNCKENNFKHIDPTRTPRIFAGGVQPKADAGPLRNTKRGRAC